MLAVGGGGRPVLATGGCGGVLGFCFSARALGLGDGLGDSPPYFSSSC